MCGALCKGSKKRLHRAGIEPTALPSPVCDDGKVTCYPYTNGVALNSVQSFPIIGYRSVVAPHLNLLYSEVEIGTQHSVSGINKQISMEKYYLSSHHAILA